MIFIKIILANVSFFAEFCENYRTNIKYRKKYENKTDSTDSSGHDAARHGTGPEHDAHHL